ncbi:MAG: metal ABC transporter ATP-binding protein [Elusimicrobia bacterium]|nr:metal ABC transporter ATP-binding protein [Elusimicrobiota bacterium]
MSAIIEIKQLSINYGQTEVIKDVSFTVEAGDYIGLAGPNGAGKTTLIKTILGLLPSTAGEIKLFGMPQSKFSNWGKIGYLPQKSSAINVLFPATVEEVVILGLLSQKKLPRRITNDDRNRVDEILEISGITNLKRKILSELSGGQQQKVLLARALVSRPELLIFDEPSTALDPQSRESFFEIVKRLNHETGVTVILITHATSYIGQYAGKLLYIDKKVVYFGKFNEFCNSSEMSLYFGDAQKHLICHQHD